MRKLRHGNRYMASGLTCIRIADNYTVIQRNGRLILVREVLMSKMMWARWRHVA